MSTEADAMDVEPALEEALSGRRAGHHGTSAAGDKKKKHAATALDGSEESQGKESTAVGPPVVAAAAEAVDASQHRLARDPSQGMNPINLATGIYGPRGERIRHVVHEGSLRLPVEALSILAPSGASEGAARGSSEAPLPTTTPRPSSSSYVLPGLDSVIRPSQDLDVPTVIVTDVMSGVPPARHDSSTGMGAVETAAVTVARNRIVTFAIPKPATNNQAAPPGPQISQLPSAVADPERIRGGGSEGGEVPAPPTENQAGDAAAPMGAPSLPASSVAPAAPSIASTQSHVDPTQMNLMMTTTTHPSVALPPHPPAKSDDTLPMPQPAAVPPPPVNVGPSQPQLQTQQQQQQQQQQLVHPSAPQQVATTAPLPPPQQHQQQQQQQEQQQLLSLSGAGAATLVAPSSLPGPPRGPALQVPTLPSSIVGARASAFPATAAGPPRQAVTAQPVSVAAVNTGTALATPAPAPGPPATTTTTTTTTTSSSQSGVPVQAPVSAQAAQAPSTTMSQPIVQPAVTPSIPPVASAAGVNPANSSAVNPAPTTVGTAPVPTVMVSSAAPPAQAPSTATATPVAAPPIATVTAVPSRSGAPIPQSAPSSAAQAAPATMAIGQVGSAPQPPQAVTQPASQPQVIPLKDRPNAQWEQHIPGPNDENQVDPANKTPKPDWYTSKGVSELERNVLYEWFDGSAPHRTPESYVAARERILEMSGKLGTRYITPTMVRRALVGDVTSLTRLHDFLTTHALINEDSQNDSAPVPWCLQDDKNKLSLTWTDEMKDELLVAVVEQSRRATKRPRLLDDDSRNGPTPFSVDWEEVSRQVGHGVSGKDCEREFLALPIAPEKDSVSATSVDRPITPDEHGQLSSARDRKSDSPPGAGETSKSAHHAILQEILDGCDPDLARSVTESALLLSGGSLKRAQSAGRAGLVLSRAMEVAQSKEDSVAHLLSEIVDLRMKKLENRLTLLDDIEGMLEAERVALELERRDLYTARCRHWFGGP